MITQTLLINCSFLPPSQAPCPGRLARPEPRTLSKPPPAAPMPVPRSLPARKVATSSQNTNRDGASSYLLAGSWDTSSAPRGSDLRQLRASLNYSPCASGPSAAWSRDAAAPYASLHPHLVPSPINKARWELSAQLLLLSKRAKSLLPLGRAQSYSWACNQAI